MRKLVVFRAAGLWAIALAGPVRALRAQCPDGTPPPCARAAAPARAAVPNSIAVLYLADLSRDTSDAYLADGLTEELIARLSRVEGLQVASRFAALRYRGQARDPRQIGRVLGVKYLLDGTLRRTGDRLHIVLAVTEAARGFNVWGETYERAIGDLLPIEDTIAVQVADALLGRGRAAPPPSPAAAPVGGDAYQAFLQARVAIRSRTAGAAALAIARYRAAIALDPRFARAWAGLSVALSLARDWGWIIPGIPVDSVQSLASAAATRALAIDSSNADAWLAAAMAERAVNLPHALGLHQRALAMDSASVESVHQLAWGYLGNGQLDTAIAWERRAIARDPFYGYAYAGLAEMLNVAGEPEQALAAITQGQVVDSANAPLYWQLSDAELRLGRVPEARAAAARASALGFDPIGVRILRAIAQLRSGDTSGARASLVPIVRDLEANPDAARGGLAYANAGLLSGAFAQLGDVEASVRWAGRVAEWPRRLYAEAFARHWYWAPVRDDPRFVAFLVSLRR